MRIDPVKFKKVQEEKDIKNRVIAQAADLSERRIDQIKAGEYTNVNLNIAKAIARCLGVKLSEIS